jgi:hypothetical protein
LDRAPKKLFYFAVSFIVVGVVCYEMASTPVVEDDDGHALENAKFRRWRKKAMRLRCRMRRREGKRSSESDESEHDSPNDDEKSITNRNESTKSRLQSEHCAEVRVIV